MDIASLVALAQQGFEAPGSRDAEYTERLRKARTIIDTAVQREADAVAAALAAERAEARAADRARREAAEANAAYEAYVRQRERDARAAWIAEWRAAREQEQQ